jgi:predicted MFS family arabinose efflux permease
MAASVFILDFAVGAIALFEPIYLFTLGYDLKFILAFYLVIYVLYFIFLPFGARLAGHWGFHHAILFSSPFLIAYFLSLMAAEKNPLFLGIAVLALPVQKILYWPSFHQELAKFGNESERGRELTNLIGLVSLATIASPIFGGTMIATVGFPALFAVSSMLIMASNIPLMSMPEKSAGDGFNRMAAFRKFIDPARLKESAAFLGFGEELLALVVWPIFVFAVLKDFAATGTLMSLSILGATLAILFIGRLADRQSRRAVLRTGTIFLAASWVTRIFLKAKFGILGIDLFHRVSRSMVGVPYMSMVYGRAKKTSLLEEIVYFEMALSVGKILAAMLGIVLLWIFPGRYEPLFILAAAFSLLYGSLR